MGYAKKRSVPSLAAGVFFGAAYLTCAYLIANGEPQLGHDAAAAASALLVGAMGARVVKTRKVGWGRGAAS